jgi:putative peptidoglycan lipid II flippase
VDAHLDSELRAKNLVNTMYSLLLIILSAITVFGLLYPDLILSTVLDPAYIAQTEKYLLTVHMAKIMFLFLFFISSFAFFMGILNALGEFFLPAIAPTLWNLSMVLSTVWPTAWLNPHRAASERGDQLAWGVVVGGFFQCIILIPALYKKGYLPRLTLNFKNADVAKVFKNMVPGLIGTGLLQFTTIINLRFSSSLAEGTISYINYIDRLIELPLSLISVSLGTALLPALSKLWSQNSKQAMAEESRKYLELNLLISIAAACGLYSLAQPIVQLLFGRGRFTPQDVLTASEILKTYCWILIFASGVRVLTPAYFAVKNTWFPAVISGVCLGMHLILAPWLMSKYLVHGLMISTMATAAMNMILLLVFYNKLIHAFNFSKYFVNVTKFVVLGGGVFVSSKIFYVIEPYFYLAIALILAVMTSAVVFILLGLVLKIDLINELLEKLSARFKRQTKTT